MEGYIENIIHLEQVKLANRICEKYGTEGNFTVNDICNRFLKNTTTLLVNDEFKIPGKRGRPRKFIE